MRKFERIRIEKGQAYIRDRGIAVLDIVQETQNGHSLRQLLENHPNLIDEDVIEALAYSLEDLRSNIAMAMADSRSPLSSLASAGALLTEDTVDLSEPDRERLAELIAQSARRLSNMWFLFMNWVSVKYGRQPLEFQESSLMSILDDVKSDWEGNSAEGSIEIIIPEELSHVCDNGYLSRMFTSLLHAFIPVSTANLKYGGQISAFRSSDTHLTVQIIREYRTPKPSSLDINQFIWNSLYVSLAVLVLRSHSSDLQIHSTDTNLTFQFTLPIWHENT